MEATSSPEKEDWNAAARALRRVYGRSKTSAWRELKGLKWLQGEPIDVLVDQIRTLLRTVPEGSATPDQLIASFLLDALPARNAEQLRIQFGEKMLLKNIVSGAKVLLDNLEDYGEVAAAVTKGYAERRSAPLEDDRGGMTGRPRCFGSHKFMHVKRTCTTTCYGCAERGHLRSNCSSVAPGNERARTALPDRAALAEEL